MPLKPGKRFTDYNIEQQGAMVEDYVRLKRGMRARSEKEFGKKSPTIEELKAFIPIVR